MDNLLNITDIIRFPHSTDPAKTRTGRIECFYKQALITLEVQPDEQSATTPEARSERLLLKLLRQEQAERKKNGRPHATLWEMRPCIQAEATHALTPNGLAPLADSTFVRAANWTAEQVAQAQHAARPILSNRWREFHLWC